MPYMMSDDGLCVHKKKADGSMGAKVKCHPSKKEAEAHMRALMTNVEDAKEQQQKYVWRPTQKEAAFEPVSTHGEQACNGCRWYNLYDHYCHVIENGPAEIAPNSYCNRYEARPEPPAPEPVPVVIVEPMEGMGGEHKEAEPPESPAETPTPEASKEQQPAADLVSKSLIDPVAEWIKAHLLPMFRAEEKVSAGFKAIPDRNVWIAWWTTTTKDLEGEVFAPQAIDDFIDRVDKGLTPYPELWFGHMPLRHGQAKWLGRVGQIAMAAGTFDDTPLAQKFVSWYRTQKKELPVSHGYKYIKALKRNGVYWHFDTFEISVLHPTYMKAANPTAKFSEVMNMKEITPEKMQALTDVLGSDELAKQVAAEALATLEQKSKERDGEGVGFKADGDAPVIPVVDTDARKELDALKTAQASLEKTLTDAVAKAVKEQAEIVAKALADELTKRDATIKALTDKIEAFETARKEEQELYAPASQSLITQIMSGSMAAKEADELKKKNAEPENKTVVDRWLTGQVATPS